MKVTPQDLKSLTPDAFEQLVAQVLSSSGFRNVVALGGTGDEGIDLRAEWLEELPTGDSRMTVWAVQCKRYSKSLNQQQIQEILNSALEPPLDLLPARPDFFLIATTSSLSPNSHRIVTRANNDRAKYGCTFIVWDGETISRKLLQYPEIAERFFKLSGPPSTDTKRFPLIRLSIVLDRVADRAFLTFLYDLEEGAPVCQIARTEMSDSEFGDLLEQAKQLTLRIVYSSFDEEKEAKLKAMGLRIAQLIPTEIRKVLFNHGEAYVRLASNIHDIPFELAYDKECKRFLGSRLRIGRIQISDSVSTPKHWPQPSVLLIGPGTPPGLPSLAMVEKEIHELSAILSGEGISVTTLSGDLATRTNLVNLLRERDYQIIHFSGHGIAQPNGINGVMLADGPISFDEILSRQMNGSLVFLSACGSGSQMNETSQQFFRNGVSSVLGFIGPVTDEAANWIALTFYDELRKGATLGDALDLAKKFQQSKMPNDWSWVSLVLFGDPTLTFMS